ncbi:MAG: 3-isopropylmalate dehydratase small subunit [Acidobacteriota bacterium]
MSRSEPSQPFSGTISGRMVPLPIEDIDTDQIIPASFLKTTSRDGLGDGLFAAWRADADGPASILDRPERRGASVLVAGSNFGCGSSREHAAWALADFGFRAVLSPKLADIFRKNALGNGLLAIEVPPMHGARLLAIAADDPDAAVTIDLEACAWTAPWGEIVPFAVDPFARECLLSGTDTLGWLLDQVPAIERHEAASGLTLDTRAVLGGGS